MIVCFIFALLNYIVDLIIPYHYKKINLLSALVLKLAVLLLEKKLPPGTNPRGNKSSVLAKRQIGQVDCHDSNCSVANNSAVSDYLGDSVRTRVHERGKRAAVVIGSAVAWGNSTANLDLSGGAARWLCA